VHFAGKSSFSGVKLGQEGQVGFGNIISISFLMGNPSQALWRGGEGVRKSKITKSGFELTYSQALVTQSSITHTHRYKVRGYNKRMYIRFAHSTVTTPSLLFWLFLKVRP
jgi:hypothetical protein